MVAGVILFGGPDKVLLTGSFEGDPPMLTLDLVVVVTALMVLAVVMGWVVMEGLMVVVLVFSLVVVEGLMVWLVGLVLAGVLVGLVMAGVLVMPLVRAAVAALTWPIFSLPWLSFLLLLMILEENSIGGEGGEGGFRELLGCCLGGSSVSFLSAVSSSFVKSLIVSFDNIFFCFSLISSNSCKYAKY